MELVLTIALLLPFAGFLTLVAFSKHVNRKGAGLLACGTVFASFACFLYMLSQYSQPQQFTLFQLIPLKKMSVDFSLHLDSLSLLMALIITGIGFLIHVYSTGYMDHEEDFARYFALLNFFIFAMLLLVLAGNLIGLFFGWEGVGVASYFLIGFWYTRPAAEKAAVKAFVVNRIGDFGFLFGIILTFYLFGTGDIASILSRASNEFAYESPIIMIVTLLYFIGATGKSAQLPLYSWLPDAMEGPTPVSALIHAATMVTAGVYLIVRLHPLFLLAPTTLQIVGIVGGVTSLFASLCALAQRDLKRVLAFSTVSQLGLMFLACGAGAFYTAMFHLTMHAFVKALLFLSAGNVVHMLQGTTELSKMGGLAKIFTKTHWLFLIGALALSGVPPLAAFFSKDLILDQEYLSGHEVLYYIGLIASILTGVYMMRAYCLTFWGEQKTPSAILHTAKEAPPIMLVPVSVLALLAIFGGLLGYTFQEKPLLESFLKEVGVNPIEKALDSGFVLTFETWIAIAGAVLGVGITAFIYAKYGKRLGQSVSLLYHQFYLNEIYDWIFVRPLSALARWIAGLTEPKVFEGVIPFFGHAAQVTASGFQKVQSGQIRSYLAWMVLGSVFLILYLIM